MNEYTVEVSKAFRAVQGLKSPVRANAGLKRLNKGESFALRIKAGVCFGNDQIGDRDWFVDTDEVEAILVEIRDYLASDTWTHLFNFRPTFELVAKWAFERLDQKLSQLRYVELTNETFAITTRYSPDAKAHYPAR